MSFLQMTMTRRSVRQLAGLPERWRAGLSTPVSRFRAFCESVCTVLFAG